MPNIISNITIPLVGMADLAIVGLLASDTLLSAIAIGTTIFNMLYYALTFLRMGTSGLTAQSYGKRDFNQTALVLLRGIALSTLISTLILLLQKPIELWALWFMESSSEINSAVSSYFFIRIWAAPATLSLYVFQGWFIGMQNSKTPMWVAIVINIVNISLSYLLAVPLGMGLNGVAYGTLIAQWVGVLISLYVVLFNYSRVFSQLTLQWLKSIIDGEKLKEFFTLNVDILIRTLCLVAVFAYFTKASSAMGDNYLPANNILLQLFTLFSYFMDGFAYAGEAMTGRYYGANDSVKLRGSVRALFRIGLTLSIVFTILYIEFGYKLLTIFTQSEAVLAVAKDYMLWAAAIPICGFGAFLWDGVLVGMTLSKYLRNSMILATAIFFIVYFSLVSTLGNSALWLAFVLFLLTRGVLQWIMTRRYF